jgi:hypothetical protein
MCILANDEPNKLKLRDDANVSLGKLFDRIHRDQFQDRELMAGQPRHTLPPLKSTHLLLSGTSPVVDEPRITASRFPQATPLQLPLEQASQ